MARAKPNAAHPNARSNKANAKTKNANKSKTKRTTNSRVPIIQTAPTIKGTPIVKSSPVKHAPAIKSLAAIKSTPRKSNQNAGNQPSTPSMSKLIDLSNEDSDCEIQKVVTLSAKEKKRRLDHAAKQAAASPMRSKRIKIEISPSKTTDHEEPPTTPSKNSSPLKNKPVQNTPQTQLPQTSFKDHSTAWQNLEPTVEALPASASKKDGKATGNRQADVSIDVGDDSVHELHVDETETAVERKRKKKEKKARRRAEKMLKEEKDWSQTVEHAKGDESNLGMYATAPKTNDFHLVRDVHVNENAHGTQQQAQASPSKKSNQKDTKNAEKTNSAPKSDGEFVQHLWGVLNGLEAKPDTVPYATSDSDCILDEQASTPRKGIRTVTRKVKIETAAANKPSPRPMRRTAAPPPPALPEWPLSTNRPSPGSGSNTPVRIEDDLALVKFHFEAIQNHVAALRYLSRTRSMRQEQVQEGFRKLARSIPRLPPPLFGKKKGSYEEVENGVKYEGLDKE